MKCVIKRGTTFSNKSESEQPANTMSVTSQIIDGRLASQIEERDDVIKVFPAIAENSAENVDSNKVTPRGNSDYDLAQRSASGEMAAFEEIYQRHNRRVYSLCLRMTQNPPEAEDLTQEVFIQLFRKIGSFRGESAFTTWLHRMTVNQVLMHFRKRSVRDEKTTEEGETPVQIVLGTANPLTMPIVDRLALNRAISQLPNGYRTVFVLHDVEGYEHEEIARIMSLSVGTSKSQLHKARMKLRNLLKQQNEAS